MALFEVHLLQPKSREANLLPKGGDVASAKTVKFQIAANAFIVWT
jgi:hypothetical protein